MATAPICCFPVFGRVRRDVRTRFDSSLERYVCISLRSCMSLLFCCLIDTIELLVTKPWLLFACTLCLD